MKAWLNYHHLFYFRAIATEGSVIKAARKLRLGQPTLSTQLKQFEDNLGQQLFERKGRTLQLTEAGQMVLEYANEIFALGDEMVEAINDRLHSGRVDVTIGASLLNPLRGWPICLRSCPPPACGRLLLDFAAADGPPPALRS